MKSLFTPGAPLFGLRPAASLVREWCLPAGCALCGRLLLEGRDAFYGLCQNCRETLIPPAEARCTRCGRILISETGLCMDCRRAGDRPWGRIFSFFPYTGRYRQIMGAYKYGKNRNLGNFFAQTIIRHICRFLSPSEIPGYWTPVPPRPGKIKKTGWDQVDFLCRCLKNLSPRGDPCGEEGEGPSFRIYPCLERLPSQSQKELNREARLRNLTDRIRPAAPVPPRVLLLDDLVTTGATLEACAGALKAGGAEEVMGLTLFYD